jgi:LemA protein
MDPILQILLIIIGLTLLVFLIYSIILSKYFKKAVKDIDQAESKIDVALTQRLEMLSHLINETKDSLETDASFIEMLSTIRQPDHYALIAEKEAFGMQVLKMIEALFDIMIRQGLISKKRVEAFAHYLVEAEESLQLAKKTYNSYVSAYNQKVVMFPSSFIAKYLKQNKKDFFNADQFIVKPNK